MVCSGKPGLSSWAGAATATRKVEFDKNSNDSIMVNAESSTQQQKINSKSQLSDANMGFGVRAFSAAGAAVLSAILVNPLDVAKTRLQAQAAGIPYDGLCSMACSESTKLPRMKYDLDTTRTIVDAERTCSTECSHYKGTLDVFYKVARQEGFSRLWRGTNASLALAVPSVGIYLPLYDIFRNYLEDLTSQSAPTTMPYVPLVAGSVARSVACITCYPIELARTRMQAFKESQTGVKPPGVWRTLVGVVSPLNNANNHQTLQSYRSLWTGLGAQLARDVPFSAICWLTLEPLRRGILSRMDNGSSASHILGANFFAGFIAGSIAAAATCPLDVARTRRQIEKNPARASTMNTKGTLIKIWRDGGVKGLFTGVGPRVVRAGPSVGIVVSFYEIVKYALHYRRAKE